MTFMIVTGDTEYKSHTLQEFCLHGAVHYQLQALFPGQEAASVQSTGWEAWQRAVEDSFACKTVKEDLTKLLLRMLSSEPHARPTFEGIAAAMGNYMFEEFIQGDSAVNHNNQQ